MVTIVRKRGPSCNTQILLRKSAGSTILWHFFSKRDEEAPVSSNFSLERREVLEVPNFSFG